MATRINKEAIDELISELYQTGFGWEAISSRVQEQYPESRVKTAAGVSTRYYRYLNSLKSDAPITTTDHPEIVYDPDDDTFEPPETPQMLPSTATDDYRDVLSKYLGNSLTLEAGNPRKLGNRRKVVACGDMHGNPSMELIKKIIWCDPDIIFNGGDLFDMQAVNPHGTTKDQKIDTIRDEESRLVAAYQIILMQTRAMCLIIPGNHDRWAYRQAQELLPAELLSYFRDPLEVFASSLPDTRVQMVKSDWRWHDPYSDKTQDFGHSEFMYLLGDTLLSHANFTDKYAGGAVRKLAMWVNEWNHPLGLGSPRCLIQFHGHKMSTAHERGGHEVWIEPGMMANPEAENYKAGYQTSWRPGANGFCYFEQERIGELWQTDLRTVKLVM